MCICARLQSYHDSSSHFPLKMSQPSQLSESSSIASGSSAHCQAIRQLHLKDETVHSHGPRKNPCAGSHKPPMIEGIGKSSITPISSDNFTPTQLGSRGPSTHDAAHTNATVNSNPRLISDPVTTRPTIPPRSTCLPPLGVRTIKHIPKPARPIFASALVDPLDNAVDSPNDDNALAVLFDLSISFFVYLIDAVNVGTCRSY